ncbi:hypothetical protein ACRJ4W_04540 [Streptomyces sp. GLT-R25]
MSPGDPVLFLPSLGRRSALAYPKGFHGTRDIALEEPAPVSGTLYGRETGPDELRRRLVGLDRVWVVAEPYALKPAWYPSDPTERVKVTVVGEEFVPQAEFVRKGSILPAVCAEGSDDVRGGRWCVARGWAVVTRRSPGSRPGPPRPARS